MDTSPLVIDEVEAGKEFLRRLSAFRFIRAACWLRENENEERYLYAALDELTDDNSDSSYGEVLRIAWGMKELYVDPFRVKLIDMNHPVAKAILEFYRQFPGKTRTGINGRLFAGMGVAELYIYPHVSLAP